MALFRKKDDLTEDEQRLSVVTFWLYVVAVFAWVIPFTLLFVFNLITKPAGGALTAALLPSLATLGITGLLCVVVYFAYRRLVLKL